jgi:hypothetical protein
MRRIYRDGALVAYARADHYEGDGDIFLGRTAWAGDGFVGAIDEVAVYRKVLSRDQLLAHYEAAMG